MWNAGGRGGGLPRAYRIDSVEMLNGDVGAGLLLADPVVARLLEAAIGVGMASAWSCAARATSTVWAATLKFQRALLLQCPSGCSRRAGCTCHIFIRRCLRAWEYRASSGPTAAARMARSVLSPDALVGHLPRLRRRQRRRPTAERGPTLVMALELVNHSCGQGRGRQTAEDVLRSGSMLATPIFGGRLRLTLSASPTSGAWRSAELRSKRLPIG